MVIFAIELLFGFMHQEAPDPMMMIEPYPNAHAMKLEQAMQDMASGLIPISQDEDYIDF